MKFMEIDEDVFGSKMIELEDQLFIEKGMFGLSGDIGDENNDTFLKTMSDSGRFDESMADIFEKWLQENHIKYSRFQIRKFTISTAQLYSVLTQK
jgi:hypothetical protein